MPELIGKQFYPTRDEVLQRFHFDPTSETPFTNKFTRGTAIRGEPVGYINSSGYRVIAVAGCRVYTARLCYFMYHGEWPINQIDHINRARDDNRIANLRDVTQYENMANTSNNAKCVGVHWHPAHGRWRAEIRVDGRGVHLGQSTDWWTAVCIRKSAEAKLARGEL